jgi:acetolactate synthase-1/2/3 large subunit
MGARAYTIRSAADLAQLDIGALCRNPGPTLLDVHIDKDEVPPMRARMKVLGMQAANVRADHTPGNDT